MCFNKWIYKIQEVKWTHDIYHWIDTTYTKAMVEISTQLLPSVESANLCYLQR